MSDEADAVTTSPAHWRPTYRLTVVLTYTNVDDSAARDQLVRVEDAVVAASRQLAASLRGGDKKLALELHRQYGKKPPRRLWAVEERVT